MTHHTHNASSRSPRDWLGTVKNNPEGLLLLAAGCALLLRSSSPARSSYNRRTSVGGDSGDQRVGARASSSEENMVTRAADTARQYATEVKDKLANTADSYATAAVNYADETKRTVMDHSERLALQAQSALKSTMDDVLNYQPLAVAFVGVAAGAAVAAAFPATKVEQRALGPTADRLSDVAASATKQLGKAASAAGDRLKTAAEERGLNADGFKEVVSEVAGTFENTITGEQTNDKRSAARKEDVQDRMPSGGGQGTSWGQGGTRRPGSESD